MPRQRRKIKPGAPADYWKYDRQKARTKPMNRAVVWLVAFWMLFLVGGLTISYFTDVPHRFDPTIE